MALPDIEKVKMLVKVGILSKDASLRTQAKYIKEFRTQLENPASWQIRKVKSKAQDAYLREAGFLVKKGVVFVNASQGQAVTLRKNTLRIENKISGKIEVIRTDRPAEDWKRKPPEGWAYSVRGKGFSGSYPVLDEDDAEAFFSRLGKSGERVPIGEDGEDTDDGEPQRFSTGHIFMGRAQTLKEQLDIRMANIAAFKGWKRPR